MPTQSALLRKAGIEEAYVARKGKNIQNDGVANALVVLVNLAPKHGGSDAAPLRKCDQGVRADSVTYYARDAHVWEAWVAPRLSP